jgi:hypothetical protein
VESNWVHSALRPPIGLLCQPRVIMMMQKLVEWLEGETEVLGENVPQCRFVHHKPHNAKVNNAWSYTSTPLYVFMARCLIKYRYLRYINREGHVLFCACTASSPISFIVGLHYYRELLLWTVRLSYVKNLWESESSVTETKRFEAPRPGTDT